MLSEKICVKCDTVKPSHMFSRDNSKKSGLCSYCKKCQKLKMDAYYAANKEKISARATQWCRDNRERYSEGAARRRKANRDILLPKRRIKYKEKMLSDVNYRLNNVVRSHLRRILERDGVSNKLRYSAADLRARMEVQFKEGMSWGNYGDWEIDHKIPISKFIARGVKDTRIINALSNLQPMWKKENRSKGARYVG